MKPRRDVEFFNKHAFLYDLTRIFSLSDPLKIMKPFFPKKAKLLVDIGGGSGLMTQRFLGAAQKILIVEPSEKMVERARKKGLDAIVGTAENTGLKKGSCDIIISVDAFHHFENHEKAIAEMHRILRKKGVIAIEEINPNSIIGKLGFIEKALGMKSKFYIPEKLEEMYRKQDFKTTLIKKNGFYYIIAEKVNE